MYYQRKLQESIKTKFGKYMEFYGRFLATEDPNLHQDL